MHNSHLQKIVTDSVLYILPGSLLLELTTLVNSIPSIIIAIFGCYLLFKGYSILENSSDQDFKNGGKYLRIAMLIHFIALFIDLIPFFGILAFIVYIIAFGIHIYGLILLKNSKALDNYGKSGINLVLGGLFLAILCNIIFMIPFVGSFIAGWLIALALILIVHGWQSFYKVGREVISGNIDKL